MISWYILSGWCLRLITPAFGRLVAEGMRLEGLFRSGHQRILQHSEEIAFLRGGKYELLHLKSKFYDIIKLYRLKNKLRLMMGIFDSMLTKYGAFNIGLSIISLPVFGPDKEKYLLRVANDPSKIIKDYEQNSSLLINLAKAVGRIIISYKKVQNLAGATSRVYELYSVIEDLKTFGRYQRKLVGNKELIYDPKLKGNALNKGQMIYVDDNLMFQNIPIITPGGEDLMDLFSLRIKKGMNTVIIGPNGCGKTALLRILAGLWPFYEGQICRVKNYQILFLPQVAYLPKGTLRDLLIYPDTVSEKSDYELRELMELVNLTYLVDREGFNARAEWYEVLSGGEKQRVSIIRMFYHNPSFAVLDEATSEISVDIENTIYMMAKKRKITLLTVVTQKKSFYNYHDYVLSFDGHGEWVFEEINHDE